MDIKNISKKYKDYVIEKRRYFHMNPEPSFCEFNTSKVIKEELDKLSIPYIVSAETGIIATIKGKENGKTVLLRADMDALEVCEKNEVSYKSQKDGLMHACGHDGHVAMLLGAAHILNEIKEEIKGEIKLLFQPAEEIATGAKKIIEETNITDQIDSAFAIHLWQGVPVGKVSLESGARMAAADMFKIKIKGKSGHGSMPHETVDAALTAAAVLMNLQHLVSRNTNPLDTLVITIGKMEAGTRFNVIAGEAVLEGTARSFSKEVWEKIPEQLERVINSTCAAYGATAEIELNRATPPLVNDEKISEILKNSVEKLYGAEAVTKYEKTPGGEDFAYFTQKVPGALAFVGIRNDEKGIDAPHHNEKFDMDERGLEIGTNLYVQFALDFLNS
ncbi:MAG: M20 family metallopeptidase [Fusobacterium gastrosuis]|uniref:M20 family metallopeptidase n=1 Tax=Fusobacterium gastrosuis TaxID=1755100 RepID=UPI002A9FF29A|nr:M20 family metallopeptidase [Fusobacteriaceae bacterium]MDY5795145.1 M20 family metallopeptidase [Fusobacterium gastrosuis]